MSEPNRCRGCGKPIPPTQHLCNECFINQDLEEILYENPFEQPNIYEQTWDDSEFEEMDFDDE